MRRVTPSTQPHASDTIIPALRVWNFTFFRQFFNMDFIDHAMNVELFIDCSFIFHLATERMHPNLDSFLKDTFPHLIPTSPYHLMKSQQNPHQEAWRTASVFSKHVKLYRLRVLMIGKRIITREYQGQFHQVPMWPPTHITVLNSQILQNQ